MRWNRRQFLLTGSALAGGAALAKWAWPLLSPSAPLPRFRLVLGQSDVKPAESELEGFYYSQVCSGNIYDYDTRNGGELRKLQVPLFAHGFAFADKKGLAASAQKWGTNAVVVNLLDHTIVKTLKAPEDFTYFGHGAFTADENTLVLSGQDARGQGALLIYDGAEGYRLARQIRMPRPIHEVQRLPDGQMLVGIGPALQENDPYGSARGAAQIVNLQTGALGESRAVAEGTHFCHLGGDRFVMGGRDDAFLPLSFLDWKQNRVVDARRVPGIGELKLKGEVLSLARLDERHAVVTVPEMHRILVWDVVENRACSLTTPGSVLGVAPLDASTFVGNGGDKHLRVYRFDAREFKISAGETLVRDFANGRHLYLRPTV